MAKNPLKPFDEDQPIIQTERWYVYKGPQSFGWKQWFAVAALLSVAILLAFGFLIVAIVVLLACIVLSIVAFIIRKLS